MEKQSEGNYEAEVVLSQSATRYHNVQNILNPQQHSEVDLTLFVSCYNEEKYIKNTLDTIVEVMEKLAISYEIVVMDDVSTDSSVTIVEKFIADHRDLNIILRKNSRNKGLAQNYIDAAFIGKGKYYRLICGDNAEPADTILEVLGMMGQADIIVPYYTSAQGKGFKRRVISKLYTKIINLVSGNNIKYYNGLQLHLRYNVMRWHPNTRGFGFQAGLLCLLLQLGFTYKEVPCVTIEQRSEKSNALNFRNLRSVLHVIVSIVIKRMSY